MGRLLKEIDNRVITWFGRFLTANQITLLRLVFTGLAMKLWLMETPLWQWLGFLTWSAIWYFDHLDGAVARKFSQVSDIGKRFDPLVDKLVIFLTLLAFWQYLNIWAYLTILILDIISTIERERKTKAGEVKGANWFGKWKLFAQVLAALCFFLAYLITWSTGYHLGNLFLWLASILAICSLLKRVVVKSQKLPIRELIEQPEI